MPRLIWAPQALQDVQRLYRFLAPRNHDAATRAVSAIRRGVQVLSLQPRLGRPVEGMDEAFRDWVIDFGDNGYVVRYRLDPRHVIVLAVRHQREAGF
jgi:plasmid stabilization system protein ParE